MCLATIELRVFDTLPGSLFYLNILFLKYFERLFQIIKFPIPKGHYCIIAYIICIESKKKSFFLLCNAGTYDGKLFQEK